MGLDKEEEARKEKSGDILDLLIAFMTGDLNQPYESVINMNWTTINATLKKLAEKAEERQNEKDKKAKRTTIDEINPQKL